MVRLLQLCVKQSNSQNMKKRVINMLLSKTTGMSLTKISTHSTAKISVSNEYYHDLHE